MTKRKKKEIPQRKEKEIVEDVGSFPRKTAMVFKSFFKCLLGLILAITSTIFSFMAFNAWHKSAYIEHIWGKVGPVHQLYFIAIMIFAGLYLVNIIARIMTCKK